MPCHTPDSGNTGDRPQSIFVNTQVHYSDDAWWDLGARELLRTCNLETVKRMFHFQLWSNWQLPQQSLLERSPSRIDAFLNELGVSVRDRTHAEKVSRIISELKDDTGGSDDDSEDDDSEGDDSEDDDSEDDDSDVEDDNVGDDNTGDDEAEDARKDKILNYILQSPNEKAVAEFLVDITSPKFAQIRFRNLVRCITQTHDERVVHNVLVRLLCARLRGRPDHRSRCDRLKKVRLR